MPDNNPKLITVQEFNLQVAKWSMKVRGAARSTLTSQTHGSGVLATRLARFVDSMGTDQPAYKVKFHFEKYGVYRAYGAGRGYVCINGVLTRGFRARSDREIKLGKWGLRAYHLKKKGYTTTQINKAKWKAEGGKTGKERQPLDWIDQHINSSIDVLASAVQEYYGDVALKQLMENFQKMRIVKK